MDISDRPRRGHFKTVLYLLCALPPLFFVLGLFGREHWILDIFAQFRIQYMTGALLLGVIALAMRARVVGVVMILFGGWLLFSLHQTYATPFAMKGPDVVPNFTVIELNKYYRNKDYAQIEMWLRGPGRDVDVVVLVESFPDDLIGLSDLKDMFPYRHPETTATRFSDVMILSKYPFKIEHVRADYGAPEMTLLAAKTTIQKPGLQPVRLYAYHAHTPYNAANFEQRNAETTSFAGFIAADPSPNKIFCGDWNLSPYSVHFKDLLHISGLKHQNYGILPQATWPSFAMVPFLKIPIDHILFSDGLTLADLSVGPGLGSDHNSLIGRFYVPPENAE